MEVLVGGRMVTPGPAHPRPFFPVVDRANDELTADLLTQRMQVHEQTAWILRSLLAWTTA
jgi:starvation-inducible DNA-binding protein